MEECKSVRKGRHQILNELMYIYCTLSGWEFEWVWGLNVNRWLMMVKWTVCEPKCRVRITLGDLKYCGILLDRCVSCPEVLYGLCRVLWPGDFVVYRVPIVVYIFHIVMFAHFAVPCYHPILYFWYVTWPLIVICRTWTKFEPLSSVQMAIEWPELNGIEWFKVLRIGEGI